MLSSAFRRSGQKEGLGCDYDSPGVYVRWLELGPHKQANRVHIGRRLPSAGYKLGIGDRRVLRRNESKTQRKTGKIVQPHLLPTYNARRRLS